MHSLERQGADPIPLDGNPRIAIMHEWLITPAGSEAVLQEIRHLFPQAVVHCVIDRLSPAARMRLGVGATRATWLNNLPRVERYYRALLPLMPSAVEALDLSAYDLVISSSHAVAKGVRTRPGALHLCYCHSPMRYAWDMQETYLQEAGWRMAVVGAPTRWMLERLRRWDQANSSRVSSFVANSAYVADRIARAYGRPSTVIHPPVDTDYFTPAPDGARGAQFVTASRLVSYKRVHAIVEAFHELPGQRLVVIGDGPDRDRVLAAAGPNVTWLGRVDDERLRTELRGARAFLFAAEEDFGIVPVEAQACGTPVIAFRKGGATETVTSDTGHFFDDPSPSGIAQAVREFLVKEAPSSTDCRANAERFSVQSFRGNFSRFVTEAWSAHCAGR